MTAGVTESKVPNPAQNGWPFAESKTSWSDSITVKPTNYCIMSSLKYSI